jgi:hypothetical protein
MPRWTGKNNWTPEEDAKIIALLDSGLKRSHLQFHFSNRTDSAVRSRARVLRPHEEVPTTKEACDAYHAAINALIDRMPAHEVAEMIGKPHLADIPGLKPVLYGQAAERRLAA